MYSCSDDSPSHGTDHWHAHWHQDHGGRRRLCCKVALAAATRAIQSASHRSTCGLSIPVLPSMLLEHTPASDSAAQNATTTSHNAMEPCVFPSEHRQRLCQRHRAQSLLGFSPSTLAIAFVLQTQTRGPGPSELHTRHIAHPFPSQTSSSRPYSGCRSSDRRAGLAKAELVTVRALAQQCLARTQLVPTFVPSP
ncbi:hypothetical protein FKP32DRAFT_1052139 [Trametes sanguinea]|nr:hypothetical protein FKP32DRAFT_1052139 [Trametes sanguinea]